MNAGFRLVSDFTPSGDQGPAIAELVARISAGERHNVLLGATGTGKTFTIANVIERTGLPAIVLSHNKTLAAQLYGELSALFPENAVEYFISYYDYYQPEAYVPTTDTYIEKDADINPDLERLRLRAVSSILERRDVVVVASVSAIYSLGDPVEVRGSILSLGLGQSYKRGALLRRLVQMQYIRNDARLERGRFRVRGETVELIPAYDERVLRLEFFGEKLERMSLRHAVTGETLERPETVALGPNTHFITSRDRLDSALGAIEEELDERVEWFLKRGKHVEAERLRQRTRYDLELMRQTGFCSSIENYSRHIAMRAEGERPTCLLDYFDGEFLVVIDESHVTVPQLRGMVRADRSRKETLVEHGFRLPSALDNRPQTFEELEELFRQTVYMSATPGPYELEKAQGVVVEQVIRPTGLPDPVMEVRPAQGMIDDLLEEIRLATDRGERVLVTTLTKRTSEELADYFERAGVQAKYLHSEMDAIERVETLRLLRTGEIEVLVGINLLREGLDLPEVGLVLITDADKTGFLRSYTALIQTAGRAARNLAGRVVLYADNLTEAMSAALAETARRREKQLAHNEEHNITPRSVVKSAEQMSIATRIADERVVSGGYDRSSAEEAVGRVRAIYDPYGSYEELGRLMRQAADRLEFEEAAVYRDEMRKLRKSFEESGVGA